MAHSRANALSFDAFFAQAQSRAVAVHQTPSQAVHQTPSEGDSLPASSSTMDSASRARRVTIDDIFTPLGAHSPAPEQSRSDDANAPQPGIHIEWDQSSSEDEDISNQKTNAGQLWGPEQFLAGYSTLAVVDIGNLQAAMQWQCPCSKANPDRTTSCLDATRINVVQLYEFRKAFHSRAGRNLRDTMRDDLERHYDARTESFSKGFRVGPCADCCAPAYGLACGLSFKTFARARADVTRQHGASSPCSASSTENGRARRRGYSGARLH